MLGRVAVKVHPQARRLKLRVEPSENRIVLVRPPQVDDKVVATFVVDHLEWIRKHLVDLPAQVPLANGSVIPFRGVDHLVVAQPQLRGGVWREDKKIFVTGKPEHGRRRIIDWLKREARQQILPQVHSMASVVNRPITKVTLRDTRTRWGSCAPGGKLSFSWRLIFAPDHVLTYVAAHEVAHLVHPNHSDAFKQCTARLLKPYEVDLDSACQWLRRSGTGLHRYS